MHPLHHLRQDDYSVKDDSPAAMEPSKTVKALCSMLKEQFSTATACLPSHSDLSPLWTAVGLNALKLFTEHLKRSRVSVAGAFILANDVNSLQSALGSFKSAKVDAALADLREIANLFLVPPGKTIMLFLQDCCTVTHARTYTSHCTCTRFVVA